MKWLLERPGKAEPRVDGVFSWNAVLLPGMEERGKRLEPAHYAAMSGVVNVGGGESRGGECRTIGQGYISSDSIQT